MRVPPGSQLVFNQVVQSDPSAAGYGTALKSEPKLNDWLGRGNEVRLVAVVDRATALAHLAVDMEEAGDEELAWCASLITAEGDHLIDGDVNSPGETILNGYDVEDLRNVLPGVESGPRQSLGFRRLSVKLSSSTAGTTARVRIWATGRNGYRKFHRLLLAERLQGTERISCAHEACAWFAAADLLTGGVQADEVPSASCTVTCTVDMSPNGRVWANLANASFAVESGKLYPFAIFVSANQGVESGFIRFGVQLGAADQAATVRLWVTGRDVRSG